MAKKSDQKMMDEIAAVLAPLNIKGHKSLRASCRHCAGYHTTSEHASHGKGSFARTHKGSDTAAGALLADTMATMSAKELASIDHELMATLDMPKRRKARK